MIIHTRTKYSILLIIPLILLILSPAVSFAITLEQAKKIRREQESQIRLINNKDADRIFKENSKAVVVVIAYDEEGNAINQGSGFIVRRDGAVVTNYHVISKAKDIKVKKGDKVLDVEGLIFTDKENNLVILKVEARNMPVVKFGNIGKADLEWVYVMTSSEIFFGTLYVEEIDQKREILFNLTTTASLPESSGSPVFNRNGEVIGVVVSPFIEGMSFRVPWIFAVSTDLIKDKVGSKKVTAIKEAGLENFEKTAGYWMIHYGHGMDHMMSGRHKEAIEAFKQVIRILPDYVMVHLELGKNYRGLGMYKEAMEAYKQAVRISPDDAYAHYSLGIAYLKLNDRGSALEQYKILKSLDSELANELFNSIYE
ncbi:MAG: tetratricopeptide repeat protein [Candidatus Scalindua sp.]